MPRKGNAKEKSSCCLYSVLRKSDWTAFLVYNKQEIASLANTNTPRQQIPLFYLSMPCFVAVGLHCKMVSRFRNRNFFWTPDARCVDNIANKNCATSLWYVSPETEGISLDEALKLIWEKNNNLSLIRPKPTRPSGTGYSSSRYILDWIYSQGIPTDPL